MIIDFTQSITELRLNDPLHGYIVLSDPEGDRVGFFPARSDITVLPADDPRKLKLGWVIRETIGIVVAPKISITDGDQYICKHGSLDGLITWS